MKETVEFVYKLTYEESYEAFYVLSLKWGKKVKNVLSVLLTAVAAGMLIAFYLDSRKIHCFFIAVLAIVLLYNLLYAPVLKAKKGARSVRRQKGTYQMRLTEEGKIQSQGHVLKLREDKDARAIETERIFVLRPDRLHTFCLPKRILTQDEMDWVRCILKKNVKYIKM